MYVCVCVCGWLCVEGFTVIVLVYPSVFVHNAELILCIFDGEIPYEF